MLYAADEIVYEDGRGNYLGQSFTKKNGKYVYTVYNAHDEVLDSWLDEDDYGALRLSQFRVSDGYMKFAYCIASANAEVKGTPSRSSKSSINNATTYPSAMSNASKGKTYTSSTYSKNAYSIYGTRDEQPVTPVEKIRKYGTLGVNMNKDPDIDSDAAWDAFVSRRNYYNNYKKTGYIEKCNNSDTLVFHLDDPSTVMLKQIYEGKGYDVITDRYVDKDEIHSLMQSHKNIICLGHGTSGGLIGGNIGPEEGPYFEGKNLFIIWCNADKYFKTYCPSARGQFITGNMPSEVCESRMAGCGNISAELMLENITYWSKLCAEALPACLEGNVDEAVERLRLDYLEHYGNHPVTIYNAHRTCGLGHDTPLPRYEFIGTPLTPKDYPCPNFDEEAFLENPTEGERMCPRKQPHTAGETYTKHGR